MADSLLTHPPVPLTLEGASVLHQFFRFDWKSWRSFAEGERKGSADGGRKSGADGERAKVIADAVATLKTLERKEANAPVRSALYSQLGHKGDLMLIHFRDSLEELNQVELDARADAALRLS